MLGIKQVFWLKSLMLIVIFALLPLGAVNAMRVSPMVVEITTKGTGGVARIEVQNLNTANLPFESRIYRLDFDEDGRIVETPADEDFLVFPPQGILGANGRQVIRLQWVGPPIAESRGYYLSVNQLPVELESQNVETVGGQVQVVYHMKALVTVAPPNAKPKVELVDAKSTMIELPKAEDGSGGGIVPGIAVRVKNTGTRHAMMAGATWTIEGKDPDGNKQILTIEAEELSRLIGVGYLAALNGERTFRLPTEKPFAPGPVKVKFSK